MRLHVEHRVVRRFAELQARVVQLLRVTPENTHDQVVASWRVDVDCDARLRDGRDGFGNRVTMLYADGPLRELALTVSGEVVLGRSDGVVRGAHEALPPEVFLRATPATAADDAIRAFAAGAGGADPLDRLHRLNRALHDRFAGVDGAEPSPAATAADAFAAGGAAPRDLAHIFCAAARATGSPARYVAGHRRSDGGRAVPHAWAEAHVDGLGWVGFDPAAGLCPETDHVRVAAALDAPGAAPVAG